MKFIILMTLSLNLITAFAIDTNQTIKNLSSRDTGERIDAEKQLSKELKQASDNTLLNRLIVEAKKTQDRETFSSLTEIIHVQTRNDELVIELLKKAPKRWISPTINSDITDDPSDKMIDFLFTLAKSPSYRSQHMAIMKLGNFVEDNKKVSNGLKELYKADATTIKTKEYIVSGFALSRSPQHLDYIRELILDQSLEKKTGITKYFARHGSKEDILLLLDLLNHSSQTVRVNANTAIQKIMKRSYSEETIKELSNCFKVETRNPASDTAKEATLMVDVVFFMFGGIMSRALRENEREIQPLDQAMIDNLKSIITNLNNIS